MTLTNSPRQIAEHVRRIAQLEVELGLREVRAKARSLGRTAAFAAAALLFVFFGLMAGLGAAVAASRPRWTSGSPSSSSSPV